MLTIRQVYWVSEKSNGFDSLVRTFTLPTKAFGLVSLPPRCSLQEGAEGRLPFISRSQIDLVFTLPHRSLCICTIEMVQVACLQSREHEVTA